MVSGVAIAAYARAVRVLRRRGRSTPRRQQAAWYGGVALVAVAVVGPSGAYADELMSAHMAEHLLLADIAAPLLIAGARTPVLVHLLPPRLLVIFARRRAIRAAFGALRRPAVAIGVYAVVLYAWHLRPAFEGALRSEALHAFQHQSFLAISVLVWWSALEPGRGRMPGELWKIGHIFAARMVSVFLGMAFIFGGQAFYAGVYGSTTQRYGLTPLADQQTAGGMMMSLDVIIIMVALTLFFWRAAADFDRREAAAARASEEARPAAAPEPAVTPEAAAGEPAVSAARPARRG
ncbi:cytochrome c oxidase assembly protein [Thermoleophilum album]|uniref:cytochrome c oxidase assembly protein n=1 Tax=Thermoleophilum album TaxID=29539 RepID=UPI0015A54392|nr:cytochrome c oxidase assembly protein [Thermoleophilum album]